MDKYARLRKSLVIFLLVVLLALALTPKEFFENATIIGDVLATARIVSGFAPTFDFNLTNYTINQTDTFILDVNCSDVELFDTVFYYDNFTGFGIDNLTGIINQSGFNDTVVGNNTINITCSDGRNNNSQTFVLWILNENDPPILNAIGPQILTEDELFTLTITATDTDGDNLTFGAATSLFTMLTLNSTAGIGYINFTPTLAQVGNYTINITVFDGLEYDWEIVTFTIVRNAFCGDTSCGNSETCSSCPTDCGSCSTPPPPDTPPSSTPSKGGGGGGGGTRIPQEQGPTQQPYYRCDEKWECSDWTICSLEGDRTRKCKDINKCNTLVKRPEELSECEYQPTCFDGFENGDEDGVDCGGQCTPCLIANCFDNIQNQDEEGIDCGGSCRPCEKKTAPKIPFIELPAIFKIPKKFPWILAIIMAILIIITLIYDQVRMRKIRRRDFDNYREALLKYRTKRKKLYKFVINIPIVTTIITSHIYYFSTDYSRMILFSWVPGIMIILVPILVMYLYRKMTFNEYRKKMVEEMFKQTHKRELLQLISVENKALVDMELKLKNRIFDMATHHKFDTFPALYKELNPVYTTIAYIERSRREKVDIGRISTSIFKKVMDLVEDKTLIMIAKDYPEFMSIHSALKKIKDNINNDTTEYEHTLIADMRLVSSPLMLNVVESRAEYTHLYNELVDVFNHFIQKEHESDKKDDEIIKIERTFADKFKEIGKKSALIDAIVKNPDFANVYNTLMDLFNHYMRKAELFGKVKGL